MQIQTGTAAVTSGDAKVIASAGNDWSGANPGSLFTTTGSAVWYEIASTEAPGVSVSGNWELNLTAPYGGTTNAAAQYGIHVDFTPEGHPILNRGDVELVGLMNRAIQTLSSEGGGLDERLAIKEGEVVNVKSHGAVGDGVADDTAALAAAWAVVNAQGGTLFLPPGTYNTTAGFIITGPVGNFPATFRGNVTIQGTAHTYINYSGAGTLFQIGVGKTVIQNHVNLDSFRVIHTGGRGASIAVDVQSLSAYFEMRNVRFRGFHIGLRTHDLSHLFLHTVTMQDCNFGASLGFAANAVTGINCTFAECDIGLRCGEYRADQGDTNGAGHQQPQMWIGTSFAVCRIGCILGGNASMFNLSGCYFEANTQHHIHVGHDPAEFSGNQLEYAQQFVSIHDTYMDTSCQSVEIFTAAFFYVHGGSKNSIVGQPFIKLANATADTATIRLDYCNGVMVRTSTGTDISTNLEGYWQGAGIKEIRAGILSLLKNVPGEQIKWSMYDEGYGIFSHKAGKTAGGDHFIGFNISKLIRQAADGAVVLDVEDYYLAHFLIRMRNAAQKVIVKPDSATRTDNLQEWQLSTGAVRAHITKDSLFGSPSFAKASLPSASRNLAALIYVTDEVGGATLAFSDGTNWRRLADRAIVA